MSRANEMLRKLAVVAKLADQVQVVQLAAEDALDELTHREQRRAQRDAAERERLARQGVPR